MNQQSEPTEDEMKATLIALGFDLDATYYLSGPMSGYPEFNYPTFSRITHELRTLGLKIESPHENPWPEGHEDMEQWKLWDHMMKLAGEQMSRCSGIILLQGWPQSRGAKSELKDALDVGWPVWFCNEDSVLIGMNRVVPDDPAVEIQKCQLCRRERTIGGEGSEHPMDSYDYSPMQVLAGSPVGWYSGSDGELCPEDMAKILSNQ